MTSADFSWQALLHGYESFIAFAMSMRPPRVLTRSFPLIPAPSTAGVPCSYWTLVCLVTSSTLHSLSGYHALWVQLLQASVLPPASFRPYLAMTPLPLAAPFPLPGGSGTFTRSNVCPPGTPKMGQSHLWHLSRKQFFLICEIFKPAGSTPPFPCLC